MPPFTPSRASLQQAILAVRKATRELEEAVDEYQAVATPSKAPRSAKSVRKNPLKNRD